MTKWNKRDKSMLSFDDFLSLPSDMVFVVIYYLEMENSHLLKRHLKVVWIICSLFFNESEDLERWKCISFFAKIHHAFSETSWYWNHINSLTSKLKGCFQRLHSIDPIDVPVQMLGVIALSDQWRRMKHSITLNSRVKCLFVPSPEMHWIKYRHYTVEF